MKFVLADDSEERIDVPTYHIVGSTDPFIYGSISLFNVCDQDTAILFDHGGGHNVPRDSRTVKELAMSVKRAMEERRYL